MKKLLAFVLCMVMLAGAAFAEDAENLHDTLTVGVTTPMNGCFFTDLWGNNATDVSIRSLLHGYNMMCWKNEEGTYGINPTVVSGVIATEDAAGNRTYRVGLYHDLVYSDGTAITPADYAFTLLLYGSPAMAELAGGNSGYDFILGMKEYRSGEADTIQGVRFTDDSLIVTVAAEYRPFFYEMTVLNINPYPIHALLPGAQVEDTEDGVRFGNSALVTSEALSAAILAEGGYLSNPTVVTGPYTLESYDAAACTATFKRNPNYKGNHVGAVPTIENIVVVPITNENAAEKLRSGEIDLVNRVTNASAINDGMQLLQEGGYSMSNYTRTGMTYISFNCEKPTVSETAVRQALAMCFDKTTFVSALTGNYGIAVDGFYGIGQWMFQLVNGTLVPEEEPTEEVQAAWDELSMDSLTTYEFDTAAAAALLDENGWKIGADGIRSKEIDGNEVKLDLTLIAVDNSEAVEPLKLYFADPLLTIGVRVSIETVGAEEMLAMVYRQTEGANDMFYMGSNFTDVFTPAIFFSLAEEDQGVGNRNGILDEELYTTADDMNHTEPGDILTYCTKWLTFQQRYTEVLPSIPAYSNVYFDFFNAILHDYEVNEGQTWADAIVSAYLSDVMDDEALPAEE